MKASITITSHLAWWWHWYSAGVYMMSLMTGLEPDWNKLDRMLVRALTLRVQ